VTPQIAGATPLVTSLNSYVKQSLPSTLLFEKVSSNLQQHGFIENFLTIAYHIAASLARFDGNSHLLSIFLVGPNNGLCSVYSTKPVPGCSAHYGSQPPYTPVRGAVDRRAPRRRRPAGAAPAAPRAPEQPDQSLQNLVRYLLK
jgi:hypothetical protein